MTFKVIGLFFLYIHVCCGYNSSNLDAPAVKNETRSSWACPEFSLNFIGNNIEDIFNVYSWEHCGELCHQSKTCAFWVWHPPRLADSVWRNVCILKSSDSGARNVDGIMAGRENCFSS